MSAPTGPICIGVAHDGGLAMRPKTNAVHVLILDENDWPYEIYRADLWECPGCHHQALSGLSKQPYRQHFEDGFVAHLADLRKNQPDRLFTVRWS